MYDVPQEMLRKCCYRSGVSRVERELGVQGGTTLAGALVTDFTAGEEAHSDKTSRFYASLKS